MNYKEGCGFREKAGVCSFKVVQCKPKTKEFYDPNECDFYNVVYTVKGIKKQINKERKDITKIQKRLKELKKELKTHKDDKTYELLKEEKKAIKILRKDKVIGVLKLIKSTAKIKRMKLPKE